ncbi:MAG TPA: tetratricopeptide repeat protein [Gemmataceae bacterium]|nr:tetratricopeptide repeat protein [Gemmataceae bacterium]
MAQHFERALVLFEQSRYDLAERELRQELASDPDHPMAHALLALCLSERKQFAEATQEARRAVVLAPDQAFAHYALARVYYDRDRYDEAEEALDEAIRLDPENATYFSLRAGIRFERRDWQGAREAAEEGLRIDPEHPGCTNLRAMALVQLGRRDEAGATIEAALARDPENAVTHANQGWALLHAGDHAKAMEHFREALRLNPELDWARAGIVEALKARHLLYGLMLRYFLWMSRLSSTAQWGVIIGGYLGYRALRSLARNNPELAPWVLPLLILYIVFAVLTWTASPLFNLLLRLNRFGRLALSREQIVASNWVGGTALAALITFSVWLATQKALLLTLALVFGMLVLPVAGTFHCQRGWPRQAMAAYTFLLAAAGLGAHVLAFLQLPGFEILLPLFFLGVLLSTFVANGLMMVQPKH